MSARPRAFRLERPDVIQVGPDSIDPPVPPGAVIVTEDPLETIEAADGTPVPVRAKPRTPWGGILLSALTGLLMLWLGLAFERLVSELLVAAPWLGWLAL